ncbi:hypothetical protein L3Q82_005808 [Scortum barcoo]|uniref:Uncharacterized protein n=1 Tax=Scortum barcoo TaxID=214431 RepID=A0ACB8V6M4_9TELE|nr:hypothetical protein L3Q82_005808 [Scortum barcoo]
MFFPLSPVPLPPSEHHPVLHLPHRSLDEKGRAQRVICTYRCLCSRVEDLPGLRGDLLPGHKAAVGFTRKEPRWWSSCCERTEAAAGQHGRGPALVKRSSSSSTVCNYSTALRYQ